MPRRECFTSGKNRIAFSKYSARRAEVLTIESDANIYCITAGKIHSLLTCVCPEQKIELLKRLFIVGRHKITSGKDNDSRRTC